MSGAVKRIDVLDKGYVRLVGAMGNDLQVVNAARASFEKRSRWESDVAGLYLGEKDERLIRYLAKHGHMSPFRHCVLSFEVKAPLMTARQWWRYHVSSAHTECQDGWNEASRRYVTSEPEFYVPAKDQWRGAPDDKKQGSGAPIDEFYGQIRTLELEATIDYCVERYQRALELGVCAEQARGFLPSNFQYVTWRWTVSLEGAVHLLKQRLAEDAQAEFRQYADAVQRLTRPLFPVSVAALMGEE